MIHHSVGNFMFYNFCTELFPRKCSTRPQNRLKYLKTRKNTKKPKKYAFSQTYFGRCSLNFRARLMYDTSLSGILYSTTFVRSFFHENAEIGLRIVSTTWKRERTRKNPKNTRFHKLILDAVLSILELGQCMLHHSVRNFKPYNFCRKLFPRKCWNQPQNCLNYLKARKKPKKTSFYQLILDAVASILELG